MPIADQMTVTDHLVLDTWEAITLLGEARERCEAADVAELLTRVEEILTSVVSELPVLVRSAGAATRRNGSAVPGERAGTVDTAQSPFSYRPREGG